MHQDFFFGIQNIKIGWQCSVCPNDTTYELFIIEDTRKTPLQIITGTSAVFSRTVFKDGSSAVGVGAHNGTYTYTFESLIQVGNGGKN